MESVITHVVAGLLLFIVGTLVYKMGRLNGEQDGWRNGCRQTWLRAAKSLRTFTTICMGSLNPSMIRMLSEHADFYKSMANYYPAMKAVVYKFDFDEENVTDLDSKSSLVFKDK